MDFIQRMNVWQQYVGKKVFLRTKNNRIYIGVVKAVDSSTIPLHFLHLLTKENYSVIIVHYEIVEIKEEM